MKNEVQGRKRKIFTFSIALFGALVLWMYAIGYDTELDTKTYTGIVVEIEGVNTNGYTVGDVESFSLSVDVRLSGTRRVLGDIKADDLSAYVDISSVNGPGMTTLPVKVVAPNGSTVDSVSVPNVTLYIDTFTSRTLELNVETKYTSAYHVGETIQSLYAVSVYGPESIISTAEAYTEVDLGSITSPTFHVNGAIKLRDAETKAPINNSYITMSSNTVELTFTMYGEKSVPLKLLLKGGTLRLEDVIFAPNLDSVTLKGPLNALSQVESLTISCDESMLTDKLEAEISVEALLHANGVNSKITPVVSRQTVSYSVVVPQIRIETVTIPASRVQILNLPEDSGVSVECMQDLVITILGTREAMESYDPEKLIVTVDVQKIGDDLTTGVYKVVAEVSTGDVRICLNRNDYTVQLSVAETTEPAWIG